MVPLEDPTFNLPSFQHLHSAKMCFYSDFAHVGTEKNQLLARDAFKRQLEHLSNIPGLEITEETVRELRAFAYRGPNLKYQKQINSE